MAITLCCVMGKGECANLTMSLYVSMRTFVLVHAWLGGTVSASTDRVFLEALPSKQIFERDLCRIGGSGKGCLLQWRSCNCLPTSSGRKDGEKEIEKKKKKKERKGIFVIKYRQKTSIIKHRPQTSVIKHVMHHLWAIQMVPILKKRVKAIVMNHYPIIGGVKNINTSWLVLMKTETSRTFSKTWTSMDLGHFPAVRRHSTVMRQKVVIETQV